jgi:RNase H-fold protein (predicted Holliday junction resolvase)
MKELSHEVDPECTTLRLKVPSKYDTLTREDIDIINTEIIKTSEAVVLIKDVEVGVYVVGFKIERNVSLGRLKDEIEKMFENIMRRYEKKVKGNGNKHTSEKD